MAILLLETIENSAQQTLADNSPCVLAKNPNDISNVDDPSYVEAIITRGKGRVTSELLEQLPNVKLVARCGVGLDNIDLEACRSHGVAVMNAPGATTIAVAEQTFYLILASVRNLNTIIHQTSKGNWNARDNYKGDDLYGKTIGLVGLGDIAQRVAHMASAFGAKVIFSNHLPKASDFDQVALNTLLSTADIISVHVPLTNSTRHIIDSQSLALMKPSAHLINTARGPHIDHDAVYQALENNNLAGFAADVFDPEPAPSNHPLLSHPKTTITPHISALTSATYTRMSHRTAQNVLGYLGDRSHEPDSIFQAAPSR